MTVLHTSDSRDTFTSRALSFGPGRLQACTNGTENEVQAHWLIHDCAIKVHYLGRPKDGRSSERLHQLQPQYLVSSGPLSKDRLPETIDQGVDAFEQRVETACRVSRSRAAISAAQSSVE